METLSIRMKFLVIILSSTFLTAITGCKVHAPVKEKAIAAYQEKYRPQLHFSPPTKWMNDPNGLVYFEGEYHLFYQYYPDSTIWGPMHWGHAVSTDLVYWKNLPIALYPDSLGYIFSGSAIIDYNNTSGLGSKDKIPMLAIFTYHDPKKEKAGDKKYQSQGLAYSLDKGRTWVKYAKNPVLPNPGFRDFRDPNVSWNNSVGKWILTLAVGDHVSFYSSPNLKEWTFESDFGLNFGAHGGTWECPDLIRMPVTNSSSESKWVLLVSINPGGPNGGSATQYFTGTFDGHIFINQNSSTRWIDYGKDNYAGITWSSIPEMDGRTLFIGWMSNWQYATKVPTVRWRSAMTLPRELSLIKENSDYILCSTPVRELRKLRTDSISFGPIDLNGTRIISGDINFDKSLLEILATFNCSHAITKEFGLRLKNDSDQFISIGFDRLSKQFIIDRSNSGISNFSHDFAGIHLAPYELKDSIVEMHIFIDHASVELFAQKGKVTMTEIFFPISGYSQIELFSLNEKIRIKELKVFALKSIWKN
jgi:fructan beta-fructosidase